MSLTKEVINQMTQIVNGITDTNDLLELNSIVKARHSDLAVEASNRFRLRQPVEFDSRRGMTVRGTITRINPKSISLTSTDGVKWKVSPNLLRPVTKK